MPRPDQSSKEVPRQGRETNFFIVDRVDRERSRGFRGAVELDGTLQEAEFPEVVVLTARV